MGRFSRSRDRTARRWTVGEGGGGSRRASMGRGGREEGGGSRVWREGSEGGERG
jgi:hypothetical protein